MSASSRTLTVAIGENPVKRVDLVRSLDAMSDSNKDRYLFLRADRAVPYGEMMDVLEILRAGGYTKIKLVALEGVPNADAPAAAWQAQNLEPRLTRMSDLDIEQKPSRRLWILAAVAALALHLGCGALAFAHLRGDDSRRLSGRTRRHRHRTDVAAAEEDTDLPAGPDTDASVASPALAEQKTEVKPTDLPKDTPTETEDPDRVVTTNDSKETQGRRSEGQHGADPGIGRIGGAGSHRPAGDRGRAGRRSIRRSSIRVSARTRKG